MKTAHFLSKLQTLGAIINNLVDAKLRKNIKKKQITLDAKWAKKCIVNE